MPPLTSFIRCRPLPLADIEQLLNGPKCAQLLPYLDAAQSGSYLLLSSHVAFLNSGYTGLAFQQWRYSGEDTFSYIN